MTNKITCTKETVEFVRNAVDTADRIGLNGMMFRPNLVSGIGGKAGMTIIMLHEHQIELDFDALAVMNPKDLRTRMQLLSEKGEMNIDLVQGKIDDNPTPVNILSKINLKEGRMKISYAAAAPKAVRAPRKVDFVTQSEINFDRAAVTATLQNAMKALTCDITTTVTLSCIKGELIATVHDLNNDQYEDLVATMDAGAKAFTHRYYLNFFQMLIASHQEGFPIEISDRGILKFNINGFTIYQLPKVQP